MKRIFCAAGFLLLGWQAVAGELDVVYQHAAEAVKKAKTAAELDAVIDELDAALKNPITNTENTATPGQKTPQNITAEQLEETRSFTKNWQEYLAAKAGGYDDKAREIARALAESSTRLISRSDLLAKAYEPKASSVTAVVNVIIDQEGKVTVGDAAPVLLSDVDAPIAALKATTSKASVLIRTDKSQPDEQIREVIQAFKKAGFSSLTFGLGRALRPQPSPAQPK